MKTIPIRSCSAALPRLLPFAVITTLVLIPACCLAASNDPQQLYQKQDSWPETMVASRAAWSDATGPGTQRALQQLWNQLQRDFAEPCRELKSDLGRDYLNYFAPRTDAQLEAGVLQKRLAQLGPAGKHAQARMQQLLASGAGPADPRWLQLYEHVCLAGNCEQLNRQVWIVELQNSLDQQMAELFSAQESSATEKWQQLHRRVEQIVAALPPGRPTRATQLPAASDCLTNHYASRFANNPDTRWDKQSTEWAQLMAAAARGDSAALAALPAVANQILQCQQELLLGLQGMPEFLAAPAHRALPQEWQQQYEELQADLQNRAHFQQVAAEVYRPDALIHDSDQDPLDVVLRRTESLRADLRRAGANAAWERLGERLRLLRTAAGQTAPELSDARYTLYADACRLRRELALSNPLLNFDDILFIKHHRALFNHMCDQYYGMAATPGGGLYVLENAFSTDPRVRDVLADSVVGGADRLAGQQLRCGPGGEVTMGFDGQGNRTGVEGQGGTFLSPDLSYDGTRVLFAYVENEGDMLHRHHVDPSQGHWDPGRCYHVFSVNLDGSDLRQLTDGTWNDFDPCWLPNGRIAFVSERRGGYLRCGRVCPTYTLFDMLADGNDIQCLSFHETNEWHPSVTNDGMILWTRWDYVDRHGCTAHMPWLTTLDGRDPRPVHGNYAPRPVRPDMEVDCRAIPGSHKLVATAAPHHGQAYGSLILIDPHQADDDGMGPVRRITPEIGFPESQGGTQVYGTAWPLSEDYYLCVYDGRMRFGGGRQGGSFLRGDYGIYLVDAFGNRELLYRDPSIASLSPIPIQARAVPPAPVELATRGLGINPTTRATEPADAPMPRGTVAVMNVYESMLPWPQDTKITALRVLQVFPMSVPSGRPPHETGLRVASAGDSVVPVRHVLGTVPVEPDGSAYFEVPANKELFFQALDPQGLAVQSMRSATHVREGERLACAGCHNPRYQSTPRVDAMPLALQRPPSKLQEDVSGSRPFSYPLLVQGVLDKHCVSCHHQNGEAAPNLAREPITNNWYASYNNLVRQYGFYDYQDGYRTTPGQFGARASKLYALLQQGHYDVVLNKEEIHRLTLWLDCASMFYGVYEQQEGQAQLAGEIAFPTLESP